MRLDCKILLVTNMWPSEASPGFGGFVKDQAESLRALGVQYDVLFINGRESRWNYLGGIPELRRRLRERRYDLIHAHFGLSGCVARFQAQAPLVVTFHGDDVLGRFNRGGNIALVGRFFQISSWALARAAKAVIVPAEEMKLKLRLPGAHVIPCGVDLDLFRPMERDEARRQLGLSLEKRYVLFPYDPAIAGKGFPLADEAVRRAAKEIPGLEMLCVRGRSHSEMPLFMNAADVFILTSFSEGSPVAVKEAMAVNLPVVSVDVGDVKAMMADVPGCRLARRDAAEIAAGIAAVCRSGERARSREAIEPFSLENIARHVLKVYANILLS